MYSIGKFAKLIGVSTHTLRLWDRSGKLVVGDYTLPNDEYCQSSLFFTNLCFTGLFSIYSK